jgi:hypothetical protein
VAIIDVASLKEEITVLKKELLAVKKKKAELLKINMVAKVEVTKAEKETGK